MCFLQWQVKSLHLKQEVKKIDILILDCYHIHHASLRHSPKVVRIMQLMVTGHSAPRSYHPTIIIS